MKILNIVTTAYRATVEEQDDTTVWITEMLRKSGADADLLLEGAATNYAVAGQRAAPISLGGWTQRHPADVPRDLSRFLAAGGSVRVVSDDLDARGIDRAGLIPGVTLVERASLPGLYSDYEAIWRW